MARPLKSLAQHAADGTFERRKHEQLLLLDELVADPELRKLQRRFRQTRAPEKQTAIALEFERRCRENTRPKGKASTADMAEELAKLGPTGSAQQVIRIFPRFFRHDDGSRWTLDRWQQEMIKETFRRHVLEGIDQRVYKEILWGLARGLGKTPIASGLGLTALMTAPGRPKIFQGAGAKDQAKLGTEYAINWIDEDPDLSRWLNARANSIVRRDGRGSYTILSAAGSLGHGRKPTVGIIDEKWALATAAQEQTVTALETALHKLIDSYLLAISTAGHSKASLLGRDFDAYMKLDDIRTYRRGFLTVARDLEAGRLMWWYGMPEGFELDLEDDAAVLRAIKLAQPGSWVNHHECLRALHRMMGKGEELEWLRLYLNAWTKVALAWLKAGVWPALAHPELEIPDNGEIFVMVDAAHSYDTTAVAWAWQKPDGPVLLRARVFSVRDSAPAHEYLDSFYDPLTDDHVAERFILGELAPRYRIREIVGDPNYFGRELARLGRRFTTAPLFPQSNEMREYVQGFYQDAHAKRIAHDGDVVVRDHVDAIAARKTSEGYWRLMKLNEPNPMDAGVAMIGARGRLLEPSNDRRSVYNSRDLRVIDGEHDDVVEDDEPEDEGSRIRARARAQRLEHARLLVERLVRLAEPIPWADLDEREADAVDAELAAAAARFAGKGPKSARALLCLEERRRRPTSEAE